MPTWVEFTPNATLWSKTLSCYYGSDGMGFVNMIGSAFYNSVTGADATYLFYDRLPEGFRPTQNLYFPIVMTVESIGQAFLEILTSGVMNVKVYGASSTKDLNVTLDPVRFCIGS